MQEDTKVMQEDLGIMQKTSHITTQENFNNNEIEANINKKTLTTMK